MDVDLQKLGTGVFGTWLPVGECGWKQVRVDRENPLTPPNPPVAQQRLAAATLEPAA